MPDVSLVIVAAPYTDVFVLNGTTGALANADLDQQWALPGTFGDCLLQEAVLTVGSVATLPVNPELFAALAFIRQATSGNIGDVGDARRWSRHGASRLVVPLRSDTPWMWGQSGFFVLQTASLDVNVAPTWTVSLIAKVRRLRGR